ncbi:MAG: hypothetical protein IKA24_07190, partial [Mogibacterium sp.]|nr:hypothetical protein [Mogibacterium sp.]
IKFHFQILCKSKFRYSAVSKALIEFTIARLELTIPELEISFPIHLFPSLARSYYIFNGILSNIFYKKIKIFFIMFKIPA